MKVDLHVHTCYSPDSHSSLEGIVRQCRKRRIDCIAITDHGTIDGALAMKKLAPFEVIVSEEVMSSQGEIIGYFLKETIPNGLPPEEVMDHIKEQGGLVCLPHPFDGMGRHPLAEAAREHLISEIDIIEVFNARSLSAKCGRMAREFAEGTVSWPAPEATLTPPDTSVTFTWRCRPSMGHRSSKKPSARDRYWDTKPASLTTF